MAAAFVQGLGKVALLTDQLAHSLDQVREQLPSIDIASRQVPGQRLALVVDDQVQLETEEPADRVLRALGEASKDAMLMDVLFLADGGGRRIDQADASADPTT